MDRIGSEPNFSIKQSVSIGTMLNFNGDGHGDGDGDSMCKQVFSVDCNVDVIIHQDIKFDGK